MSTRTVKKRDTVNFILSLRVWLFGPVYCVVSNNEYNSVQLRSQVGRRWLIHEAFRSSLLFSPSHGFHWMNTDCSRPARVLGDSGLINIQFLTQERCSHPQQVNKKAPVTYVQRWSERKWGAVFRGGVKEQVTWNQGQRCQNYPGIKWLWSERMELAKAESESARWGDWASLQRRT